MVNQPGPDGKLTLWDYVRYCSWQRSWARCVCQNAIGLRRGGHAHDLGDLPGARAAAEQGPPGRHEHRFIAVTVGFCILIFLYYVNVALPDLDDADDAGSSDATRSSSRTATILKRPLGRPSVHCPILSKEDERYGYEPAPSRSGGTWPCTSACSACWDIGWRSSTARS